LSEPITVVSPVSYARSDEELKADQNIYLANETCTRRVAEIRVQWFVIWVRV
jgi:hypothetical protein